MPRRGDCEALGAAALTPTSLRPRERIGISLVLFRETDPVLLRRLLVSLAAEASKVHMPMLRLWWNAAPRDVAPVLDALQDTNLGSELILRRDNVGYAQGHNLNLAALFGDGDCTAALVVNPDVVFLHDAVVQLAGASRSIVGPHLIGPLCLAAEDGRPTGTIDSAGIRWSSSARHWDDLQGSHVKELGGEPYRVRGVTGACVYVPRAAYHAVGAKCDEFFDSAFLAYREDAELGIRAEYIGVPSFVAPEAHVLHERRTKSGQRSSALVNMLGVQNRFLMAFKLDGLRPGNPAARVIRDALVLLAAFTLERESATGVRRATSIRRFARNKGAWFRLEGARPRSL